MQLTKIDMEIADRYISKREKQLARWPNTRWVMLVIYSVLLILGCLMVSDGMRSVDDDKSMDLLVNHALGDDPPPGLEHRWVVGSMIKITKILEARHQLVTYSIVQMAIGFMWFFSGVTMVCLTVLRWNIAERDGLICKLLRMQLQELGQGKVFSD